MHTTEVDGTVFNHNGDFSGDVRIVTDAGELWVPFVALKALVAAHVGLVKIANFNSRAITRRLVYND